MVGDVVDNDVTLCPPNIFLRAPLMRGTTAARAVVTVAREYFSRTAVPDILWSDGWLQFTSQTFATFLREWGVEQKVSPPAYPQSNGKSRATVIFTKN